MSKRIYKPYTYKPALVYPPAPATGVNLVSPASAWAWGAWVEIVPVNTITSDFIIVGVEVRAAADSVIEVQIGTGAPGAETPIITVPWNPGGSGRGIWNLPPFIPVRVPMNSRVAGRITDSSAASQTHTNAKIIYQELPL